MKNILLSACVLLAGIFAVRAQDSAASRGLTMAEYQKTPTFFVKDLDKDTYVKFENAYILDKGGFGKPYFITGDDGRKKRIDLYKLILKDGRIELGTMIFYSNEKGQRWEACMPGYKADAKVWEKYFEDIHAIEKDEPNFVLKLSYVLSKELGYQLYRNATGAGGKDVSRESGTYGNDICFPGDMEVAMAGGVRKPLSEVKPGDAVVTVDPVTHQEKAVVVKALAVHAAKNYAITKLLLVGARETWERQILLSTRVLEATPNHPMTTAKGEKKAGELAAGDKVLCMDARSGQYEEFEVWDKKEGAGGMQKVYNIVAAEGNTLILNGVMVKQK
jgi:hypothetical protein